MIQFYHLKYMFNLMIQLSELGYLNYLLEFKNACFQSNQILMLLYQFTYFIKLLNCKLNKDSILLFHYLILKQLVHLQILYIILIHHFNRFLARNLYDQFMIIQQLYQRIFLNYQKFKCVKIFYPSAFHLEVIFMLFPLLICKLLI